MSYPESSCFLAVAHVQNMYIRSEADVVREIVSVVVGIRIDHDIVGVPVPIVAVIEIIGSH